MRNDLHLQTHDSLLRMLVVAAVNAHSKNSNEQLQLAQAIAAELMRRLNASTMIYSAIKGALDISPMSDSGMVSSHVELSTLKNMIAQILQAAETGDYSRFLKRPDGKNPKTN